MMLSLLMVRIVVFFFRPLPLCVSVRGMYHPKLGRTGDKPVPSRACETPVFSADSAQGNATLQHRLLVVEVA